MKRISHDNFRNKLDAVLNQKDAWSLFEMAMGASYLVECKSDEILWILRHIGRIAEAQIVPADNRRVQSAAIFRSGSRLSILFNEGFIRKYIETPICLLHVILHELGHKIRGDLFRPLPDGPQEREFVKRLTNIVADILLNSFILHSLLGSSPQYHFKLYKNRGLFSALLCPPEFLFDMKYDDLIQMERDVMISEKLVPAMEKAIGEFLNTHSNVQPAEIRDELQAIAQTLARFYYDSWMGDISFDAALNTLTMVVRNLLDLAGLSLSWFILYYGGVLLIGDHNPDDDIDPWDGWPLRQGRLKKLFKSNGAVFGNNLMDESTNEEVRKRECSVMYEAIRRSLTADYRNPTVQEQFLAEQGVMPMPARREAYFLMGGYQPLLYQNHVWKKDLSEWRVHIYVDVSGSVHEIIPVLFGLIAYLKDIVGEPVYAFSNQVVPLNIKDIQDGRYRTTGGTDFDCIARHAIENRFRRILVITDGHARLDDTLMEEFTAKVDVYALLTGKNWHSDIIEAAGGEDKEGTKWWQIPQGSLGK